MAISFIRAGLATAVTAAVVTGTLVAGASTGSAAAATSSGEDFTSCMRSHGLPDFPTTTFGANGQVTLQAGGTAFDPFSTTYRDALRACASHLPADSTMPGEPTPPSVPALSLPSAPTPPVPPFQNR